MTALALSGTPRQVNSQLSILVEPHETFRPRGVRGHTGCKGSALWDARGHYWQMRDPRLALDTELCVNPLDAPTHLPLDWGLRW